MNAEEIYNVLTSSSYESFSSDLYDHVEGDVGCKSKQSILTEIRFQFECE